MDKNKKYCSFCNKDEYRVQKLIAGPNGIFICDECIDICRNMIEEDKRRNSAKGGFRLLKPAEIKEELETLKNNLK